MKNLSHVEKSSNQLLLACNTENLLANNVFRESHVDRRGLCQFGAWGHVWGQRNLF